jgi:hypothetical protein
MPSEGGITAPAIIHNPGFARQSAIDHEFISVMNICWN